MKKAREILMEVPVEAKVRNGLMKAARYLVAEKQLRPPGDYNQIRGLADEVLAICGYDSRYREFTMVICGNELWRPVVEATPFNRRLLLLPQCLRNTTECQAVIDQLGLICSGCRQCSIDGFLETAESLGYASLVAEGTTVAVSLVQEGSVDAVIGVSCMSVLEKSFETVSRAAVPVIGIPLLFEGCANTDVDRTWLNRELTNYQEDEILRPLPVSELKNTVQEFFTYDNLCRVFQAGSDKTGQLAIQSMLNGGQRIRPLLASLAYKAYAANCSDAVLERLAVIVESFHKASLIHDDVEDHDDFRYGVETLHKTSGAEIAINTGDYLLGKGYQMLGTLPLAPEIIAAALNVVSSGHVDLSLGQGTDLMASSDQEILSLEQLLHLFGQKTGAAIRVALLLGATVGSAPPEELSVLFGFSQYFGIAYQIRDDLHEFREQDGLTQLGDYPLLLSLLADHTDAANRAFLLKLYRSGSKKQIDALIQEYGIENKAGLLLQEYIRKSYAKLDELKNLKMRLSLYRIVGKTFEN